eukprot:CAMPEP_0113697610 /NCGR_PEP_ID=MMETSP0038_2-20120614/22230_1 /TAXON_ID=2898 /ORGANISM="Cryptomonas paramecium" /LENGTH=194 /DNA_ID=CAMNT_0000620641 /DNA_START=46 /DNA_END=627 /DNA_ORIENTATION=- /assembly_acc=CAM_ASM_000170
MVCEPTAALVAYELKTKEKRQASERGIPAHDARERKRSRPTANDSISLQLFAPSEEDECSIMQDKIADVGMEWLLDGTTSEAASARPVAKCSKFGVHETAPSTTSALIPDRPDLTGAQLPALTATTRWPSSTILRGMARDGAPSAVADVPEHSSTPPLSPRHGGAHSARASARIHTTATTPPRHAASSSASALT